MAGGEPILGYKNAAGAGACVCTEQDGRQVLQGGGEAFGFEGLDAVRAARGETLPYDIATPATASDWVFTLDESPWLAERHRYELQRYSAPRPKTHQHYVLQFDRPASPASGS